MTSKKKILIADDSESNLRVMEEILKHLGYNYDSASNGIEVMQKARENTYDAAILDCVMPEKTGVEATREIKEMVKQGKIPYLPIIGVSASVYPNQIEEYYKAGMDAFLPKPVSQERIKSTLESFLEKSKSPDGSSRNNDNTVADYNEVLNKGLDFINNNAEIFYLRFLEHFMNSSVAIQEAFENTDIDRQVRMLKLATIEMVIFSAEKKATPHLQQMAEQHRNINSINEVHFEYFIDSIIKALKDLYKGYDESCNIAWRVALTPGIEFMKHYRKASSKTEEKSAKAG